ncbi:MAG TPA: gamma-glutamyl-gamma-aminobutyrate hydrolase family protein [Gemmatimonadota bacterium]|nr:gamma-glutamyl-gamma-aminobutyrate hydrolase family protein [Gemmatimonadota bacterium]
MKTRIGIVKPGSTYAEMILRFGDYDAWFARTLGSEVACQVYEVQEGELPDPAEADGWIVTGARGSVARPEPWAERLFDWIREIARRDFPLLGVCFGHQAICEALGGRVERHPGGWEIGTTDVELTEAGREDPLFAGFPERFRVQTTHEDYAALLPPDATLLAVNPHTEAQAIALGPWVRGVQFHPEVTEEIARDFVARRRHLVPDEPRVDEAPHAPRILSNFVEAFVRPRRARLAEAD